MNENRNQTQSTPRYSALGQLVLARLREFYREPEAVFWVYGFPILMVVALGIAFRNKPVERISVDVPQGPEAEAVQKALAQEEKFVVKINDEETTRVRLRTAKTDVVVVPQISPGSTKPAYEYRYDPTRSESLLARDRVDDALQRAAGRKNEVPTSNVEVDEPGGRYIDFLIPGLLGMSIMGGGLWGVGFVTVDMRIRKLLKRFIATPMRKSQFLAGIMISRILFLIPEVLVILIFSRIAFGVVIQGSIVAVVVLIALGAFTFMGLGLLVASRAKTIEAVSGLMNLVMLPMWVLSGIFFSSERFPAAAQPFIKAIPLTPLIDALRAVMQEGTPLLSLLPEMGILLLWGVVTFVLALRWFRWQ